MSPRRALVAAALAGALVVVGPLGGAFAAPTPTPPTDDDVRAAQQAVQSASDDVAAMEVRLAQLAAVADDAQVAVDRAGEAYSQALADAQAAQQAADDATARSAQADGDAETARQNLMAYAREMARSGGSVDTLEAVLSANGFEDVAQRTADLSRLTGKADETVQSYRAAQLVAATLRQRADDAAAVATAKQADAQTALQAAQQAQSDADAQVAAAAVERDDLVAQLAEARQTSIDVEKARQDEIDRQAKQRADDAAKAARLASSSASSGGSAPATGGSGTTVGAGSSGGSGGTASGGSGGGTGGSGSSGAGSDQGGTSGGTDTGTGSSGGSGGTTTDPGTGSSGSSGGAYGLGTGRSRGSADQGNAAVAFAMTQLGKEYVWGATGPDSYDCSGLTMTSWRNAGVNLNRTSRDQYKQVLKISYDELRPGDLVFWTDDPSDPDAIYHVAMWAGNGQIVEAARPGVPLRVTAMRWAGTMPYAGRP